MEKNNNKIREIYIWEIWGGTMKKKFDILTPLGMIAGLAIVSFGIITNADVTGFLYFIDPASLLIVLGGVFGAMLVSFPLKDIKKLFVVIKQAFTHEEHNLKELIDVFVSLSERARKEGLLSLENAASEMNDPFMKKGILLAVDGLEPEVINDIMNAEISAMEERHKKGRMMLERAADLAPAWGMIGTLIGLVLMLRNLNDPDSLGPNMAVAIITTFYGSVLANLFFLPMANKLAVKTEKEVFFKQIIIEGVIGVQSGQNPHILEEKLSAFLSDKERLVEEVKEEPGHEVQ